MARAMTVLSDRKLLPEKDVRRTQGDVRRCGAVGDLDDDSTNIYIGKP